MSVAEVTQQEQANTIVFDTALRHIPRAAYDIVGPYAQDKVNGFEAETLDLLVQLVDPRPGQVILDGMAGDGNLTERIIAHYQRSYPGEQLPCLRVLEYSPVQCALAGDRLHGQATVLCTSILDLAPSGTYDRIVIKSGLHELTWEDQQRAVQRCAWALRPGGQLIALGFALGTAAEREDFAQLALVKDALAGMRAAVEQRYFVTQAEWHALFQQAGLSCLKERRLCYRIDPCIVAAQYFGDTPKLRTYFLQAFTGAMGQCAALAQAGALAGGVVTVPGRITVAVRPLLYQG